MSKSINKNHVLALLAVAQFIVVLDASIVNVALPAINRDLNFSPENLQWIVTAYTLAFGGFLLFGGRGADLFGRRKVFMLGVIAFTITSLIAGLSQTSGMLIAARAAQGLAAAFMSPAALSIVINTFKEGKERNRALGVWGAIAAGGAAAGLLLGGILTELFGWRWDFFVNVPIGIAVAFLAPRIVPESKADVKHMHLDLPGAVLVTSGLMTLVYGLVKAPEWGWTNDTSLAFFGGSFLLLAAFIFNEMRSKQPLMPLSIFKIRNLSAANLVQLPVIASMFAMFFFISLFVQNILGYTPIKTGLAFLPVTIVTGIASGIVSQLVGRIGYKPPIVVAPLLMAVAMLMFSRLQVDSTYWQDVFPGLMVLALGLGFTFVTLTIAATSGVPKHESGLASGILNTSQQIGGALGLAVLSGVFAGGIKDAAAQGTFGLAAEVAGYQDAFLVAVGLALSASIIAFFAIRHVKGENITSEAVHAV